MDGDPLSDLPHDADHEDNTSDHRSPSSDPMEEMDAKHSESDLEDDSEVADVRIAKLAWDVRGSLFESRGDITEVIQSVESAMTEDSIDGDAVQASVDKLKRVILDLEVAHSTVEELRELHNQAMCDLSTKCREVEKGLTSRSHLLENRLRKMNDSAKSDAKQRQTLIELVQTKETQKQRVAQVEKELFEAQAKYDDLRVEVAKEKRQHAAKVGQLAKDKDTLQHSAEVRLDAQNAAQENNKRLREEAGHIRRKNSSLKAANARYKKRADELEDEMENLRKRMCAVHKMTRRVSLFNISHEFICICSSK